MVCSANYISYTCSLKWFSFLILTLASACGGGSDNAGTDPDDADNGTDVPIAAVCTDDGAVPENPVVYLASLSGGAAENLLLVDADNPEAGSLLLHPPLAPGQSIESFQLSPDNRCVIFIADAASTDKFELYSASLANPGTVTRLSPTLAANRDVTAFAISPDGTEVLYRADQDVDNRRELYLVDVSVPGESTKINAELISDGDVSATSFTFSPDGTQILYAADQSVDDLFELFLVEKSVPGVSTRVNPPFEPFVNLATGSKFSPDGNWIGYIADQDNDTIRELYMVDVFALGVSIKLNPPYADEQDMCSFEFSPDSTGVAYCADQDTNDILELYSVGLSAPGISDKLNPPLVPGGEVRTNFEYSANSQFIVYMADQETNGVDELYRVEIQSPGVAEKLNDELVLGGDVDLFDIRPDDLAVAYVADQEIDTVFELYEVPVTMPGQPIKLNAARQGNDLVPMSYDNDGTHVIYVADQRTADNNELFRVDIATPSESTRLSATLQAGGQVSDFVIIQ